MNELRDFRYQPGDVQTIADKLKIERFVGVEIDCMEDLQDIVHDVQNYGMYKIEDDRLDIYAINTAECPEFYGRLTFCDRPAHSGEVRESECHYIDFFLSEEAEEDRDELFWI